MQHQHHSPALAVALWPEKANRILLNAALVVAGTMLLTISAKVKVPFYPVPMTMQTLVVLLIGATYGSRLAVATVIAYIAQGMIGLPVFTNTPPLAAGPAYLLSPTAGFVMSWIGVAAMVGWAADRGWDHSVLRLGAVMLAAVVFQFALGFAWLAWFAQLPNGAVGVGASAAFAGAVAPFLLGDALKIALAALAIPAAWQLIGRRS